MPSATPRRASHTISTPRPWDRRDPDRWSAELDALHAKGWGVHISADTSGLRTLAIRIPLTDIDPAGILATHRTPRRAREPSQRESPGPTSDATLRIGIRFRNAYPHVPPVVVDTDRVMTGMRHTDLRNGTLCLNHPGDWDPETLVADLLATQIPKLIAAADETTARADVSPPVEAGTPFGPATTGPRGVTDGVPANHGRTGVAPWSALEVAGAETISGQVATDQQAVIVTDRPIPPDIGGGALLTRFSLSGHRRLGSGLVEVILAGNFQSVTDVSPDILGDFVVTVAGRWARDPGFDPTDSPRTTWRRIATHLRPLQVHQPTPTDLDSAGLHRSDQILTSEDFELIGLLVPDETGHRTTGESWVFLQRVRTTQPGKDGKLRRRWTYHYRRAQHLSRDLLAQRTPATTSLADRHVLVAGLGAIGMPLAVGLAHAGVGRITVVDRDGVDVATGSRQSAPLWAAGEYKSTLAETLLRDASPFCRVTGLAGAVESAWDRTPEGHVSGDAVRMLRDALLNADLVIDATANLDVTHFLAAARTHAPRTPTMTVSATAGAWGGLVTLLDGTTACWDCVGHYRYDRALPVPPADPADGWVTPTRCPEPTFTGDRASLVQVALHACTVATNFLCGTPMAGNYHVASLRDSAGKPAPISWKAVSVERHPACPRHHLAPKEGAGPGETRVSGPTRR